MFYVLSYTIVMFFNSALIAVVLQRLDGEPAGVGDGLQAALSNLPAIIGYALIAAMVGTILRAIEDRVGFIGRIVTAIIGGAWTLATAMTLPVLIAPENVGPIEGDLHQSGSCCTRQLGVRTSSAMAASASAWR